MIKQYNISSIARPVLTHYVLVNGGGVRVSDVTRMGVWRHEGGHDIMGERSAPSYL